MSHHDKEVLISCENLHKKFCKDLKRSLWYGLQDLGLPFFSKDKHYQRLRKDEFWALEDINFELRRGECLGLIGHNGAGKSTLLKMLSGLILPDLGKITIRGRVGALIELGAGFNPILTGRENIYNNGAILGFTKREIDAKFDNIVDFSEISDFIDTPVQNYSSGMKVRLGFAIAAQIEPDILLIDEVLAVGDLGFVIKCLNRIGELIPNAATIFVSHNMPMVSKVSSHALLMNQGKVKFFGADTAEAIKQYVNLFESPVRINQGTGDIELIGVEVFNPKTNNYVSDQSAVLHTYDDLKLRFDLLIKDGVDHFQLFITVFDGQLREVISASSATNKIIFNNNTNRIRTFEVVLPKITLSSGKFAVTLGAENPFNGQFFARISNCAYFSVKAIANTWATAVIPGVWGELTSSN
jgi:lipopolysaccharide transport system ATP-binding protein